MKRFLKILKNLFSKKFTLMIVPTSGATSKSISLSSTGIILILGIIIINIMVILSLNSRSRQLSQIRQDLNKKNLQMQALIQEQKAIKPALKKSYQVTNELNRLKEERLKITQSFQAIQKSLGRLKYQVSRNSRFRFTQYSLSYIHQKADTSDIINKVDQNFTQIAEYIALEQQEQKELIADLARYHQKMEHIPTINPLQKTRVTSWFGSRIHPTLGYNHFHTGIDLAAFIGTKVYATADGKVSFAGYKSGYGYTVIIDHSYGYKTVYGHNSKLMVKVGAQVKKGQIISLSGNTGTSTGPHLHYEVRIGDKPVNPVWFLRN
jgi:murein DD-endopeptidase MepM/ murein hydrolase activator NlpD